MVVPAFGFSFGDFINAVQLINRTAKALRETDGAAAKYQQAAIELDSLRHVLRRVQPLRPNTGNVETMEKIQLCGLACYLPLSRFVKKIERFETRLGRNGGSQGTNGVARWISRSGQKVQRAVAVEEECMKLKASITPQMHAIEVLLQLESLERIDDLNQTPAETCEHAKKVMVSVDDLKGFADNPVAIQHQVLALLPLVERLSTTHAQDNNVLLDVTRETQSSTSEVQVRLGAQEAMLKQILRQIDGNGRAGPNNAFVNICRLKSPSTISMDLRPSTSRGIPDQSDTTIDHFYWLLLAIRCGVTEVIHIFMCILPTVQRLLRSVVAVSRTPTLVLQDNIHLEDTLGRTSSLPYEYFRYWPVLQARLQKAFNGVPGEDKVKRNQFHILNMLAGGNLVLTDNNWSAGVFPGSKLAMSMLLRNHVFEKHLCPRCQTVDSMALVNTWTEW